MAGRGDSDLKLGHHGAGDDCMTKMVRYGSGGALAGAAIGTVQGCFIKQVPGSTTLMLVRALKLILDRTVLIGAVGGTFTAVACVSAQTRDRDDHMNAAYGGMMAGSLFGLKYRSWPLGLMLAAGMGFTMAAIKYRHGTYLPPYPTQGDPRNSSEVGNGE